MLAVDFLYITFVLIVDKWFVVCLLTLVPSNSNFLFHVNLLGQKSVLVISWLHQRHNSKWKIIVKKISRLLIVYTIDWQVKHSTSSFYSSVKRFNCYYILLIFNSKCLFSFLILYIFVCISFYYFSLNHFLLSLLILTFYSVC